MRRILAVFAVAAGLAVPATGAAAPAPASSVQIASQAVLVAPTTLIVTVNVQCAPTVTFVNGVPTVSTVGFVGVQVTQTAPTAATGGGSTTVVCDNTKRPYAVTVNGFGTGPGFQLGKAEAAATACGFTCDSDVRTITIVS